jgi:hypothetical protein
VDPSAKGNQQYRTGNREMRLVKIMKNAGVFFFFLEIFSVEQVVHTHASVTSRLRSGDPSLGQVRRLVP